MCSCFSDSYDYLKITDGGSHTFDVYCGEKTGESIEVTGDQVVLTFHSDDIVQLRGFSIFFTTVPFGTYSECFRSFTVYIRQRGSCFSSTLRQEEDQTLDLD